MRNDKFLVEFVNHLTKKDVFIGVWLFGAGLFSFLMWSYLKKANRRNFREDDSNYSKSKSPVVSGNKRSGKVEKAKN